MEKFISKTRKKAITKARALLRTQHESLMYVKIKDTNGRCYCGETQAIEMSAKVDDNNYNWQRVSICKECGED